MELFCRRKSVAILVVYALLLTPLHQSFAWESEVQKIQARGQPLDPERLNDFANELLAPVRGIHEPSSALENMTLEDMKRVMEGVFKPINTRAVQLDLKASDIAKILDHKDVDFYTYASNRENAKRTYSLYANRILSMEEPIHLYEIFNQFLNALITLHDIKKAAGKSNNNSRPSFEGARAYMLATVIGLLNRIITEDVLTEGSAERIARNVYNSETDILKDVGFTEKRIHLETVFLIYAQVTGKAPDDPEALREIAQELNLGVDGVVDEIIKAVHFKDMGFGNKYTMGILGIAAVATIAWMIFDIQIPGVKVPPFSIALLALFPALYVQGKLKQRIQSKALEIRTKILKKLFGIDVLPCDLVLGRNDEMPF